MSAPLWRGTTDLTPGKEKWSYTGGKARADLTWSGPYADCLSSKPSFGQELTGYAGMYVTGIDATELSGGAGRLDITLEAQIDGSSLSFAPLGASTFELEFAEVSRPLETHPLCGVLTAGRNQNPQINKIATWEDWQVLRDGDDYDDSGEGVGPWEGDSKWTLATYQALKARGEDSYVFYAPVVRRTTIHLYPPPDCGAASGKLQTPPSSGFAGLGSWSWLGGPDRVTKSARTYTRTTEWHGAPEWSTDVYFPAS